MRSREVEAQRIQQADGFSGEVWEGWNHVPVWDKVTFVLCQMTDMKGAGCLFLKGTLEHREWIFHNKVTREKREMNSLQNCKLQNDLIFFFNVQLPFEGLF